MRYLYTRPLESVLAALLALLCLVVLTGVVTRYAFNQPVTWSEEVARYFFIWISFVGAGIGVKHGANFGLNLVSGRLSARGRWLLELAVDVTVAVFGFALMYYGWKIMPLARMVRGSAVDISMDWIFLAIPAGGLLMVWYSLAHLWRVRRGPPVAPAERRGGEAS
jgi:TRAP-type C4-dicarboxylate transport system permease small subunit